MALVDDVSTEVFSSYLAGCYAVLTESLYDASLRVSWRTTGGSHEQVVLYWDVLRT